MLSPNKLKYIKGIQKFARIWDACAEFDKPVATQFKMRRKRKDDFQEREKIFGWHFSNYEFKNLYDNIATTLNEKKTLIEALNYKVIENREFVV